MTGVVPPLFLYQDSIAVPNVLLLYIVDPDNLSSYFHNICH
ncbi:unknown [Prevotella sp. CAG:1124]|nr:unknown [Prevotella sp. CAG:1124]